MTTQTVGGGVGGHECGTSHIKGPRGSDRFLGPTKIKRVDRRGGFGPTATMLTSSPLCVCARVRVRTCVRWQDRLFPWRWLLRVPMRWKTRDFFHVFVVTASRLKPAKNTTNISVENNYGWETDFPALFLYNFYIHCVGVNCFSC